MSGVSWAIGAQEFAGHAAASPPSLLAAYVLRAANEKGDIAGNPASQRQIVQIIHLRCTSPHDYSRVL
jgi:hypothetical protein